jgi:hypothetical protein
MQTFRRMGPSTASTISSIEMVEEFSGSSKPPVLPRWERTSPAWVKSCNTLERNWSGQPAAAARSDLLVRVPEGRPAM